jgi:hypothetical protein
MIGSLAAPCRARARALARAPLRRHCLTYLLRKTDVSDALSLTDGISSVLRWPAGCCKLDAKGLVSYTKTIAETNSGTTNPPIEALVVDNSSTGREGEDCSRLWRCRASRRRSTRAAALSLDAMLHALANLFAAKVVDESRASLHGRPIGNNSGRSSRPATDAG